MAKAALANGRFWQSDATGIDNERVAALEAAVGALGDDDPNTRAFLLIKLAVENVYSPDHAARVAYAEEALATARTNGDPLTVGSVLSIRHNVILGPATIEQRQRENKELLTHAEQSSDPNLRYYARTYGYFWRLELGDIEGARTQVREGREIASRLAQPMYDWIIAWMDSGLARIDGNLDEAEACNERALAIGTEAGIPDAPFFDAVIRVNLLDDRDALGSIEDARRLCALAPPHYPGVLNTLAMMEIAAGNLPRARDVLAALRTSPAAPWSESGGPRDASLSYATVYLLAEAALGEPSDRTHAAYDMAARYPGQFSGNIAWAGPSEVAMAAVAALCGHADDLDALVDTSLAMTDATASPMYAMRNRIHCACGLRIRNRPGDRDRAARLVDEAIALGDRIGAGFARVAAAGFPALQD
jgi:hypothetical protein